MNNAVQNSYDSSSSHIFNLLVKMSVFINKINYECMLMWLINNEYTGVHSGNKNRSARIRQEE